MSGIEALRRTLSDLWDESLVLVLAGILGGILSLLLLPIPFVMAAHYNMALHISERRVVSVRRWFALGRENLRFFVQWSLLVFVVTVVLVGNVLFYLRLDIEWAWMLAYAIVGLLLLWILPQPFVPAFYLQQTDQSATLAALRTALRNTVVLLVTEPLTILLLWLGTAVLALPLAYLAWPLLPVLVPVMALFSTNVVRRYAQPAD